VGETTRPFSHDEAFEALAASGAKAVLRRYFREDSCINSMRKCSWTCSNLAICGEALLQDLNISVDLLVPKTVEATSPSARSLYIRAVAQEIERVSGGERRLALFIKKYAAKKRSQQ
jgi:hypothetical protein